MTLARAFCVLLAMAVVAHAQPPDAGPDVDAEVAEADPEPGPETDRAESESQVDPELEEPDLEPETDVEPEPEPESEPENEDYEADEYDELDEASIRLRYYLARVDVRGNERTRARVIRSFVEIERGAVIDPESDVLEALEWRLRGTGWFKSVRLSLEPAPRRNWVVLVIEVEERNSITMSGLTFGVSEGLNGSRDTSRDTVPYLGATVADTNFVGTGSTLGLSTLLSPRAYGFRLFYDHPRLFGDWAFRVAPYFYKARQYFGNEPSVSWRCDDPTVDDCEDEAEARSAVIFYRRSGASIGTGASLGGATHLSMDYQLDVLERRAGPDAGSERFGTGPPRPIDFAIHHGTSFVSMFRLSLTYDKRDDPAMTSRGVLVHFNADLGHHALGSDYDFLRTQVLFRAWQPLSFGSLRFGVFAGAVFGDAPFYLKFNVSDLTDLIPSRQLEMQLDRRAPPNLLRTSISELRNEELAARLDLEYAFPIYRSRGSLRGINAYFNVGVYTLLDQDNIALAIPGFEGASRAPLDLTFDAGLRFDTRIGVLQIGLSTIFQLVTLK